MKLSINYPDDPDDTVYEVAGLGLFKNHSTTELDDEQLQSYKAHHGFELEADLVLPVVLEQPGPAKKATKKAAATEDKEG